MDAPFDPEDYSFTADLLRQHSRDDKPVFFQATCSNNLNIILAALDQAAAAPDFRNQVRSLYNIDRHFLPELNAAEWQAFRDDPPRYYMQCDKEQSAAIWREVCRRQLGSVA